MESVAVAALAAVAASAPGSVARAQDTPGAAQLDTVVVTARKREENAQTVPISMTVLEGGRLDISPAAAILGLGRSVPNLGVVDLGGQAANFVNIRGVGSFSPVASDDTSVVFYVDEVPQSVYGVALSLLDVERVEVLRGPQGTLFGRNTQGGAISIVPRRPTSDGSLMAGAEGGSNGYVHGEVVANGPIASATLAGRFAASWTRFDGDIPNIVAGGKDGGLEVAAVRGTLLWRPDAQTEAVLALNYGREVTHSPRFMLRDAPSFPVSATNPRIEVDGEAYGATLHVRRDFSWFALTSLSAVQRNRSTQAFDLTDGLLFSAVTGLPAAFFNTPGTDVASLDLRETTWLQEIRLSSLAHSAVAWTAGASVFRSDGFSGRLGRAGTPAFLSVNGVLANDLDTTSYAAFGEAIVPLAARLKGTLGLRATHEEKKAAYAFAGQGLPGVVPAYAGQQSLKDDSLTGRAALSYDWSPAVMTYVSVARGHVSAGLPAVAVNSGLGRPEAPFPASQSWTYEAGFKSTLAGARLSLNGSVFYNDVTDGHLAVFNPAQALFSTAALDYRSYGGEIEARARPAAGVELFGGLGYIHAELRNIPGSGLTGARDGNRTPNVPKLTANVGAEIRQPASLIGLPGKLMARVTWQHAGARAADVANSFELRSYGIVNARVGWQAGGLALYAFANNLFDKRYQAWGQSFGPVPSVRVGQGRILGAGVSTRF